MQFKLAQTYRYWWPVTVRVPDPENPGQIIEQQLKVQLVPLSQKDLDAAQDESVKLKTVREVNEHGIGQLLRVVRNWEGVVDDAGEPVPFTEDGLRLALQHAWFRAGIQKALHESQNGEAARLGN